MRAGNVGTRETRPVSISVSRVGTDFTLANCGNVIELTNSIHSLRSGSWSFHYRSDSPNKGIIMAATEPTKQSMLQSLRNWGGK